MIERQLITLRLQASRKEEKDGKKQAKKDKEDKAEAEETEVEEESQEVKVPIESKSSSAAIWRHPLEEWQVSCPIIKPTPTVVSNRQTNAAAARTRAQVAKSK